MQVPSVSQFSSDIDDFDPLDDILLSDEDVPESNSPIVQPPLLQKAKADLDVELKKEKKKMIIAELFGIGADEESKDQEKSKIDVPSASPKKANWLELKVDTNADILPTSTTATTDAPNSRSALESTAPSLNKPNAASFTNNKIIDRRRSAADKTSDLRKSKQHFKSLDLDLLDFDSSFTPQKTSHPLEDSHLSAVAENNARKDSVLMGPNKEDSDRKDLGQDFYIPSSNISRKSDSSIHSRNRFTHSEQRDWLSDFILDKSQKLSVNDVEEDSLPTWLKSKSASSDIHSPDVFEKTIGGTIQKSKEIISNTESEVQKGGTTGANYVEIEMKRSTSNIKIDEKQFENKPDKNEIKKIDENRVAPSIADLKDKQDQLKQLVQNQTESMTVLEQEIRDTVVQLIHEQRDQQRDNMKALLQIMSFDNLPMDKNLSLGNFHNEEKNVESMKNVISQLQVKLNKHELEKAELEMKLKYIERKHIIDLAMLEDVYKCKLQMAEEKEEHYQKEIQNLENEYDKKLTKRKEEEDELIRVFNEKIKTLKEEHINELKHIAEVQNLTNPWKFFMNPTNKSEMNSAADRELVLREIAVEDKHRELLELEERLNRQKQALENKEISLNTRMENLETKTAKEKVQVEQKQKDVKLAQTMLEEKETYYQRELQRQKEHLTAYRQELEIMKEELLKEEGKLIKEKFEICAERARIEAIMNAEGSHGGHVRDVIQSRAELQGTIDELRRLKTKLESERNEVKLEDMHLKEESWRLRQIEQELRLQQKNFEKILRESETKREEGMEALKKARKIENQFDERMQEIEKRVAELNRKEELLTQEKIELSKERDVLTKKRYQLEMLLPQLSYEEQMPFNLLNKNLFDPRIMMMKLKTENTLNE